MILNYLDSEKFNDIPLLKMKDNNHGGLPFYIREYDKKTVTPEIHRHEYMQINYVSYGKGTHLINGHAFEIIKGDIFVIPPYIPHQILAVENFDIKIFEFEFNSEFINQNIKSMNNIEPFFDFAYLEPFLVSENQVRSRLNLAGNVQTIVQNILGEVIFEYKNKEKGFDLIIKSLLLKLLVIVGREFSKEIKDKQCDSFFDKHRESMMKALNYVDDHYMEELSIEQISKIAMLSQSYFCYFFKNITSKTFTDYLNDLRISKVVNLLKETHMRVLDISYEVGFNNISHFNRLFKQYTGVSPTEFRKHEKSKKSMK